MKIKRPLIAVAFIILFSASWRAEAEILNVSAFLPLISNDFSDLDARDAKNNALSSPAAIGELLVLFRQSALKIAFSDDPHAIQVVCNLISQFSSLFKDTFFNSKRDELADVEVAIVNSNRRFVHNVDNLWVSSSVGSWVQLTWRLLDSLSNKPQMLFLRC